MIYLRILRLFGPLFFISIVCCPPISTKSDNDDELESMLGHVDYANYLTQVIKELQGDADFNKNVGNLSDPNAIGQLLKHASGRVRSKLDELKRIEISRLNKLYLEWEHRTKNDNHPLEMPLPPRALPDISHLHDLNTDSFNSEDLVKLIERTTAIMNKIDEKDEESYKNHEMEKKAEKQVEFNKIPDENIRKERIKKWSQDEKRKRSQHKPIHQPGSIEHLKSIWKEDDHMDSDSFDPKSFFFLHDLNNDGNWDIAELETLMQRELDKAYDHNDKTTDFIERDHEMTRMRNDFLHHVDKDKNHLVSFNEYKIWIGGDESKVDKNWKIQEEEEKPLFTEEEFDEYYKHFLKTHEDLNQPTLQPTVTKSP